jgi:peptide/nickel transport system substrate-binding protein
MVQAAVSAAQAGAVTRGDLEALVAKSIQEAAADQLSAEQVQAIVSASLEATNKAIDEAAMAAQAAGTAAMEAADLAKEAKAAQEAMMVVEETGYMAEKINAGSFGRPFHIISGTSNENFPQVPYKESPMSAAAVAAGTILPVDQRLPDWQNVFILPPGDEIGVYGGSLRTTRRGNITQTDMGMGYGLEMSPDGLLLVPSVFRVFESNDTGDEFTFMMRNGARWSDSHPHTMEDIRFALEDLMLNKELMPGLPAVLRSPITGNDMRVQIVDDSTFKVFFDDPNFSFMESTAMNIFSGIKGCPRCFISPSHIQKRYHIKFNNAEIPAILEANDQPNWVKNFSFIRNVRGFDGPPSEPIPTDYDINYIYRGDNHYNPIFGGYWALSQKAGSESNQFVRNHYHPSIDPEGNQLPYMDGWTGVQTESREVGIFRTMNGESDWLRRDLETKEMPLYLQNSVQGDYSVLKHDSPDGADSTFINNQEYVDDPEIGMLLRTRDFRIALSVAWDRNGANQSLASGLGTPQNMVPHPSTPYFPGEHWRTLDTDYDLNRAKSLMTKMGYTDADGDGYLDKKDGSGPLSMFFQSSSHYPFVEWLQSDFKALGIKLSIADQSSRAGNTSIPPTEYFEFFSSTEGGTNPWSNAWNRVAPTTKDPQGPAIGQYYATRGEEGMPPTGPDEKYTDVYGKMAPDGTYPADISGNMLRLQELITEGWTVSLLSPARVAAGQELFRINSEQKYKIGGVAYAGLFRALKVKRNNMRNVPKNWSPAGGHPVEWFYFEDGIDNVNHPGNRSTRYASTHFLQCPHIASDKC